MSDKKENTPQGDSEGNSRNDQNKNRNRNRNRKPKENIATSDGEKASAKPEEEANNNRNKNRNRNRNRNKQKGPVKDVKASPLSDKESTFLQEQSEMFSENVKPGEIQARTAVVLEKPTIGITCGDLNGIGFELIIKTLENKEILDLCTPVIFSSSKVASYHKNALDKREFNFFICNSIEDVREKKLNLINTWEDNVELNLGTPTDVSGAYALKSIDAAISAAKAGKIDAILTAPINKHNIAQSLEGFKGHTGYLSEAFGDDVLMILSSEELKVATVTGHVPISQVAESLSKEKITRSIELLAQSLKRDFCIVNPSIAVLGLNPHAGEMGTIGVEEEEIIKPAIESASEIQAIVKGPFPADGFFGQGYDTKFDAVLGMYHDQVLVPFKALAMGRGTNFTSGLSVVRTSPDHGTAMHLAGKNKANEHSFRSALFTAIDVVNNRKAFDEMTANPIKKQNDKR